MKYTIFILGILVLLSMFFGTNNNAISHTPKLTHHIHDRHHRLLYRVRIEPTWICRDPLPTEDLSDTTKSICEFIILDDNGNVRMTIHNFPSDNMEERIPPIAQITRWQRQFDTLSHTDSYTIPQAFSGYCGLMFYGSGLQKEKEISILGWAMQLGAEHYRSLSHPNADEESTYKQMRSDITIKAVGPSAVIDKYKEAIISFARSFELIEEIPVRS